MVDEAKGITGATGYTYSPEYNRAEAGVYYRDPAVGELKLDFDYTQSAIHSRFGGYGMRFAYEHPMGFVRAIWRGISHDGKEHSLSGSHAFGVGGGYHDIFHLHDDLDVSLLISAGVIASYQPVGPVDMFYHRPYGYEEGKDGPTWFVVPKGRVALQALLFEDSLLNLRVRSGGTGFGMIACPDRKHEGGASYFGEGNASIFSWDNKVEAIFNFSDLSEWAPDWNFGIRYMFFFNGVGEVGENEDVYTGLSLKNKNVGFNAEYTYPIRRDLYAGDAVPLGRLHALKLSAMAFGERWLAGVRYDHIFNDDDKNKFVTYEKKNRIGAIVGLRLGLFEVFAQFASTLGSFDPQAYLNLSFSMGNGNGGGRLEDRVPGLPLEHLPNSVMVDDGNISNDTTFRILEAFDGDHPLSMNCDDESCRDRVKELRDAVGDIITDDGLSGKEKGEHLLKLGRGASGIAEQFFIIYTAIRDYGEFNLNRGPNVGLFNIFENGNAGGDCKGFSRTYRDYFMMLGISSNRLRDSFIDHNHRALFFQLDDGRWVVMDKAGLSPPIETKNYWEALDKYSGNSHCRGYIDYDGHTMFTGASVKAACGEQWQQMWGLSEFLIMHPERDERFFDTTF
ncbi:MAG: hypothetical protein HN337_05515 [Deltaproteobacteria bacterium]|nr:hypothetical protein [Deltaproteobacteria bacterium]